MNEKIMLKNKVLFGVLVVSVEFGDYLHYEIVLAGFYSIAFHAGLRRHKKNSVIRQKILKSHASNFAFFDCPIWPNQCYSKSCIRINRAFNKLQKTSQLTSSFNG
jgi:hypothetical protein